MENPTKGFLSDDQFKDFQQSIYEAIEKSQIKSGWLRKDEAAKYARVSVGTFRKWVKNGLPVKVIDGVKLYKKSEIDNWIENVGENY